MMKNLLWAVEDPDFILQILQEPVQDLKQIFEESFQIPEQIFTSFLEEWEDLPEISIKSITFNTSSEFNLISLMLANPFPIRNADPAPKKLDDAFIKSLTELKANPYLLHMSNLSIEGILDETQNLVLGFKLVFLSADRISTVQTCRSKLAQVKDLEFEDKLVLFNDILSFTCHMICEVGFCWSDVDDIPIAVLHHGKFKFIPFYGYRYMNTTESGKFEAGYNWSQMSEAQKTLERKTGERYFTYFESLFEKLFKGSKYRGRTDNKISKSAESFKSELESFYRYTLGKGPSVKDSLFTLKNKVHQFVTKYALPAQEEKISKPVSIIKVERRRNQQEKLKTILEYLNRYEWLVILDISEMPSLEVKKLQFEVRKLGLGEYQYVGVDLFIKQILPQLKQFKVGKAPKKPLADLLKGQISLFFSNEDIFSVKRFIQSFVYKEKLDLNLKSTIPKSFAIAGKDIQWTRYNTQYFDYFHKAKVNYGYNQEFLRYELLEDLKVPAGTLVDSMINELIRGAIERNKVYERPYNYNFKIIAVLENGYQVPLHLLNVQKASEECVMKSLRAGFDYVRAIELETLGKATDFAEDFQAISKFVNTFRLVLGMEEYINEKLRNDFTALSSLFEDFSEPVPSQQTGDVDFGLCAQGNY